MRIKYFLLVFFLSVSQFLFAQHLQLREIKGEVGVFGGLATYNGDISPQIQFLTKDFGAFYKKQLNDYAGVRVNYESLSLAGNDFQSIDLTGYEFQRGMSFYYKFHDVSIMGEFHFFRFITDNKNYRFTPYLGFGVGTLLPADSTTKALLKKEKRIITMPINLGFKYNITGPWNVFAEATYRFTSSDRLDSFADSDVLPGSVFQASTSGKDQYYSVKMGISYNLIKIHGPDLISDRNKAFYQTGMGREKKSLFRFFKRK
ncbi:MAG: DUF6089 family protein [Sediminibacterium sp.]